MRIWFTTLLRSCSTWAVFSSANACPLSIELIPVRITPVIFIDRVTPRGETTLIVSPSTAPSRSATPLPTISALAVERRSSSRPWIMSFSMLVTRRSRSGSMP